ncbi:MAG: Hsp20/alpha crystallin family protein [Deltaproteobacteria bacterium]|nr:Hsp20/alpha crystallin family protein [Deltaproteobacteria bacterium]
MAKMSKKPAGSSPAVEIDNINQFIFEGMEDTGIFTQPEPITQIPNVDVYSNAAEVIIEAELPGVRKQEIDITLLKQTLTIKALKFECFEEDKINYVCMERSFGRIFRAIELPYSVDTARIKAIYKNGVLTIVLPRVEDKRSATKKVPIESI